MTVGADTGEISLAAIIVCGASNPSSLLVTPVAIPAQPDSILGLSEVVEGVAEEFSIQDVNGADIYTWSVPSGWTINSGQNTISVNVTAGIDTGEICVYPSNDCGMGTPICKTVSSRTFISTKNISFHSEFSVYPNPGAGDFIIKFESSGDFEICVFNSLGKLIHREHLIVAENSKKHSIRLNDLASGVYALYLHGENDLVVHKIIVQ